MSTLRFDVRMALDEKMLRAPCSKAEIALAYQVMKDTVPFVPKRTGSLRQRTYVDGNKVIYPGPYARFLYNGVVMVDPATGSAWAPKGASKVPTEKPLNINEGQSHWFEASKAQNIDKWERVYGKAVAKGL